MKLLVRTSLAITLAAALASPAYAAVSTAFRVSDLDLRDPHMFVSFLGCRDFTDTPLAGFAVNPNLQTSIQTDGDSDGYLDMNLVLIFDPLDQTAGVGTPARWLDSQCTAPMASSVCGPYPGESTLHLTATTGTGPGSCLGTLAGTIVHVYTPAITPTTAPCFSSDELTLTLNLGVAPVTLRNARIAATYSGSPATQLVNGVIRGFLSEADANSTIIPASVALVGGQPLSMLLPGGDPPGPNNCCAAWSDKDLGPDGVTPGWWMYLNFSATQVPYTGARLAVEEHARPLALTASPSPSYGRVTIEFALALGGNARVTVHDLLGREVARLTEGRAEPGTHRVAWDGLVRGGAPAAPGLYIVRLASETGTVTRTIVRLR